MTQKTLIFDFDGTIADSFQLTLQLVNQFAEEFGFKSISSDDVKILKDKSLQEVIRHLEVPVFKIPTIVRRTFEEVGKNIQNIHPIENLEQILHNLHATAEMGILTTNSQNNVLQFLNIHRLDIFQFISPQSRLLGKHQGLKKILQEKSLNPADVTYVGDETRDVEAAQKVGIKIAAVTWGYNSKEVLMKYKPDYLFDRPEELLSLVS